MADGRGLAVKGGEDGYFTGCTLFDHVRSDMKIYREEIFGPVLSCMRVPDFEAAAMISSPSAGGESRTGSKSGLRTNPLRSRPMPYCA